ncbi:MAG TPA: hypothetical protein VHT03_01670 [Rhizomicrobium sp.]|jgi:predicted negative regulator of RcsB-dependent stress response|nr:hypothetical protein [Rhizomicrobium sp.]
MQLLWQAFQQFGPYGLIIAASGFIIWTLWKDRQEQAKTAPLLLERVITALNNSTAAIDKNTAAKEENTRVSQLQSEAFNRLRDALGRVLS